MKTLLILRHGKSSWKNEELLDHDRPLAKRGKRDALRIGRLLRDKCLTPDVILSSTAKRARKTAEIVAEACGYQNQIECTLDLYHARPRTYVNTLNRVASACHSVMIVGHNPDLEVLFEVLTGAARSLPTAALAHIAVHVETWSDLSAKTPSTLLNLWLPDELEPEHVAANVDGYTSSRRDWNLAVRTVACRSPQPLTLADIANQRVITVSPSDPIHTAISKMERHDIRHLPVVTCGSPVGMVSDRDLASSVGWSAVHTQTGDVERHPLSTLVTIEDIMSTPIQVLSPNDSLETATSLMLRQRISAVPIVHQNVLVGIISESDFLKCCLIHRGLPTGTAWERHRVGHYMKRQVLTLQAEQTATVAFRMMREHWIRHLPVLEDGRLIGIVSERDVRKSFFRTFQRAADESTQDECALSAARNFMTHEIRTVLPDTTLSEAAQQMLEGRIGALPVLEDDKLVGIITETDLLWAMCDP